MPRAGRYLPILLFFSLACGLVVPVSPPTPTLDPVVETSTAIIQRATETQAAISAQYTPTVNIPATQTQSAIQRATEMAAPTPTLPPTPTPEPVPTEPLEDDSPPAALVPGESYRLEDEYLIDSYAIRYWRHTNSIAFEDVVLIEKNGMESIRVEQASGINLMSGEDINGDGSPEVVIDTYTGGAHCCYGTQVYSLENEPVLILDKPASNAGGEFDDIDNDGIYEFVTADDVFVYEYCPYVSSPFTKVIMVYDAVNDFYAPASPNFPDEYEDILRDDTRNAERVARANISENGEWDGTTKCSILPIMLDYIYLGDMDTARAELDRLYKFEDINNFWNEVLQILRDSKLYVASDE